MSTSIGRVENPHFLPAPRFFIHDNGSDYSLPPLFEDPDEALRVWDQGYRASDLEQAVPAKSGKIMVAKIFFAWGRRFGNDGDSVDEPIFGLITEDRLISTSQFNDPDFSLLRIGDVLHISFEVEGGYGERGPIELPICGERPRSGVNKEPVSLEDVFDQPLHICTKCAEKVLTTTAR